ncbi:MAG TPA: FAD-binding oxidoreductase [Microthrixaceae bacterium]|nr:FAD-binding oxidoreductase [Microthrixaceae bacterium]
MFGDKQLGSLVEELAAILDRDPSAILTEGLERFSEPARGKPGDLDLVLVPGSIAQVQQMIRWARSHGLRLIPQGANSGLVEASTPGPGDVAIVMSTDRLAGEIEINPTDRTAVVSAGVRLSALNEKLSLHGLRLPIDLGADPTIGGMAATNTGGARMLRHGDMRRHVLGLEAVLADDEVSVVDELSTLRKNNTGLALTHLLVGSGGSLGVITRVAVEVEPIAGSTACAWLIPRDPQSAIAALNHLEKRWGSSLSAFEVASLSAIDAALKHIANLQDPFAHVATVGPESCELRVLIEFESEATAWESSAEARLVEALAELDEARLIVDAVVTSPEHGWHLRHSISEGLRLSGTIVGFDVSIPRSLLPTFLDRAKSAVRSTFPRATVADFGHWGDGGVHCSVIVPFEEPLSDEEYAQLRQLVFSIAVEEFGGCFSAEHGVGPANADWWKRSKSEGSQRLTHAIKAACDPLGVLGHPRMPY